MNSNDEKVKQLSIKTGYDPIFIEYLIKRGYEDESTIKDFLIPSENTLDPFIMSQMEMAVDRIRFSLEREEKILIFGDYDCDGICSTSILKLYFDSVGADCVYYIPSRSEGYGLNNDTLERLIENYFPDLIITVDCGIASVEEVELCIDLGVDIIVTDHHEPQELLPDCTIVNPKIDENSPFHDLCGAGVAYKLVEALAGANVAKQYLDIAAIATVADIVPLVGVNRSIVYHGLKLIEKRNRLSIKRLLQSVDLHKVNAIDIGFRIAPRINAPGRMGCDLDMVSFFTSNDEFVINELLQRMEKANSDRQQLTQKGYNQALEMLDSAYLAENKIIVLYNPEWQTGILGLIASKLTEQFYRPTILLADAGECLRGSARSIDGVNIFECLSKVSDQMISFGGHQGAAGMSLAKNKVSGFTKAINRACESLPDSLFIPKKSYDILLEKKDFKGKLFREFALLEPTGEGNPEPIFAVSSADIKLSKLVGSEHIKGVINSEVEAIGFSKSELLFPVSVGAELLLCGTVSEKEYKNRKYLALGISDHFLKGIDGVKDNSVMFSKYLKTGIVNDRKGDTKPLYRVSEIDRELDAPTPFGKLFIAYSKQTADQFLLRVSEEKNDRVVLRTSVGIIPKDPLNTLVICPESFVNCRFYSSIVFLDSPISAKYLNELARTYTDPEFVLIKHFGFVKELKSLDLKDESIEYTVNKLYQFIQSGKKASDLNEVFYALMSYGYKLSYDTFYVHFCAIYEIGWVKIASGFNLVCRPAKPDYHSSSFLTLIKMVVKYVSEVK